MAHADARQWQRFGYPADIQLRYEPVGAQPERVLAAVSFDLSLGGLQLRAAAGLALGARVTCRLPDAHGGLSLPARVRWSRPDDVRGSQLRYRLGLEFEPLPASVQQNLQAIVSQVERAGEMVKVQVPNWSEPLCAVSEPSEHGVRLRLPLPFWSGGSIVRFETLHAAQVLEGRVVSAELYATPGSQSVELELLLSPCEPARKRRYLMYDDRTQGSARERDITEAVPLAVPKTRINTVLVQAAIVAGLFCLGFGVTQYVTPTRAPQLRSRAEPEQPQTETSVQAASTPAVSTRSTSTVPSAPFAALEVPKVPSPLAAAPASDLPVPPLREPQLAPSVPSVVLIEPGSALSETPATTESTPPIATSAPSETQATTEPEPSGAADAPSFIAPMLSSTNETTEIFVPVSGAVSGLASALWVDPPAVVVDLPSGKLELSQTRYDLDAGGVSALRVGRSRGVTQLRVYLTAVLSQFDALPARGGIVIRLRRDLQSLPH